MSVKSVFPFLLLFVCFQAFASRNTIIVSSLTNNIVCDPATNFYVYGPNNGAARWQTAKDTLQTPDEVFHYNSNYQTTQSDSILFYRRMSYDYSDTSNWLLIRYVVKPTVTNASEYSVCSGTAFSVVLTATSASTFSYTGVGSMYGASSGTGNTINQTLTNPSNNSDIYVQYYVTATSVTGSCVSPTKLITVYIRPKPQITNLSTYSVCSDNVLNYPLTASVPCNFTWKVNTVSGNITGARDSSGNTLTQLLHNPSNSLSGTVSFALSAVSVTGSCSSNVQTFTLTVKPLPIITTVLSDTVCSGIVNEQIYFSNSIYSNMNWTVIKQLGPTGATNGSGTIMKQSLTNTSTSLFGMVEYSVTLTSVQGGCTSPNLPLIIYVAPVLGIHPLETQTICNGTYVDIIPQTDYPGNFIWSLGNSPAHISGALAALQQKPGIYQKLQNTGSTVDSVIYKIKHVLATRSCISQEYPVVVRVAPGAEITLATTDKTAEICSDDILSKNLGYNVACSLDYVLLNPNDSILATPNGSGNKFTVRVITIDTTPQYARYRIFPYATEFQCKANTDTITIKVNPSPNPQFTTLADKRTITFLAVQNSGNHHWYFGNGDSSTLANPQHTYAKDGKYTVAHSIINTYGCKQDSSRQIEIINTGLTHLSIEKWKLYPIPATQSIFIETALPQEILQAVIINNQGSPIRTLYLVGSNRYMIDVSTLETGVYIMHLMATEYTETKRILIQH